MHQQRLNAARGAQPSGSPLEASAIFFFRNRGIHDNSASKGRSRWLHANAKQFIAELDDFRGELACRFIVDGDRGREYWQKNAIDAAGQKLAELVERHCDRVVIHDPGPLRVCLRSLPAVMFAEFGNWADFLMTVKRMQLAAQGPGASPVHKRHVMSRLREAVQRWRNEPMTPRLPSQAFFMLCDGLGALPPKLCTVLCRDLHQPVDKLLHADSAGELADCGESVLRMVTAQLAQQRR